MTVSAGGNRTINLISTCANSKGISGPGKVFHNLVRGLEKIGQPYVVNMALNATHRLWVHDDLRALVELPERGTMKVLGPNLVVLPQHLPTRQHFADSLYLLPSPWVVDLWRLEGFAQCPLRAWAVGIDAGDVPPRAQVPDDAPVLVYFKERDPEELERVLSLLRRHAMRHEVISYGSYAQSDYLASLRSCSFVIWLGRQESQGIALQEALATDVPVLVVDAISLFQQHPPDKPRALFPPRLASTRTTSAPYFDERCGIKVDSLNYLDDSLALMRERLPSFEPREFVRERLSLEKRAREFVGFFEELEDEAALPAIQQPDDCEPQRSYRPRPGTRLRLKTLRAARRLRERLWHAQA